MCTEHLPLRLVLCPQLIHSIDAVFNWSGLISSGVYRNPALPLQAAAEKVPQHSNLECSSNPLLCKVTEQGNDVVKRYPTWRGAKGKEECLGGGEKAPLLPFCRQDNPWRHHSVHEPEHLKNVPYECRQSVGSVCGPHSKNTPNYVSRRKGNSANQPKLNQHLTGSFPSRAIDTGKAQN